VVHQPAEVVLRSTCLGTPRTLCQRPAVHRDAWPAIVGPFSSRPAQIYNEAGNSESPGSASVSDAITSVPEATASVSEGGNLRYQEVGGWALTGMEERGLQVSLSECRRVAIAAAASAWTVNVRKSLAGMSVSQSVSHRDAANCQHGPSPACLPAV
jgi:hypothetical protein